MNAELSERIKSTSACVLHLHPLKSTTTETELADLLWKVTGINFDPQLISIEATRVDPKQSRATILVPREVMAQWMSACITKTTGISVHPEKSSAPRSPHQEKRNKNGVTRLVTFSGRNK